MLTPDQVTALRAKVFAEPEAAAMLSAGNSNGLWAYLNTETEFIVWRTRVSQDEIMQNGFDWTRVDNLSVGAARVWEWMFDNMENIINPSKPNVRAGIDAVWKGTAQDLAVRAAVYVHCKRAATNAERMLATGTGATADPGTMTFEGECSHVDANLLTFHDDGTIWTPA